MAALGSHAEAEDAAQDAFVLAWRRLDSFRGDASFRTWLLTIAWHQAINRRRTLVRWWKRTVPFDDEAIVKLKPWFDPDSSETASTTDARHTADRPAGGRTDAATDFAKGTMTAATDVTDGRASGKSPWIVLRQFAARLVRRVTWCLAISICGIGFPPDLRRNPSVSSGPRAGRQNNSSRATSSGGTSSTRFERCRRSCATRCYSRRAANTPTRKSGCCSASRSARSSGGSPKRGVS